MTVNDVLQEIVNNYQGIIATTTTVVALIWTVLKNYSTYSGLSNAKKKLNNESALLLSNAIDKWVNNKDNGHYKLVVEQAFFSLFGKALSVKEIMFLVNFNSLDITYKTVKYYKYLKCNIENNALEFKYPSTKLQNKTYQNMLYPLSIMLSISISFIMVLFGALGYISYMQKEILIMSILLLLCFGLLLGLTYLIKQTVYKKAALTLILTLEHKHQV